MSGYPSQWPLPRSCTTQLHGDRRWQGPGGGARDVLYGRVPEDALPKAAGARYFAMDVGEDVGEAPAAERPAPLLEVLPQEQAQRRTVEQIVDPVLEVPMLQMVAPQMVEQLVDILTPKIVCPPRAARTVLGAPQTVEQLVEAPTIVSLIEVIWQPVEQPVDIPVRAFLPGQYSSSSVEQIVDIPVPHHGFCGGFQGFHQDRAHQRVRSRSLTFQFRTVAGTSKILVSHRFLKKLLGKRFKGFLALFPGRKKVRRWVRARGRN